MVWAQMDWKRARDVNKWHTGYPDECKHALISSLVPALGRGIYRISISSSDELDRIMAYTVKSNRVIKILPDESPAS